MIRILNIILLATIGLLSFWLYQIKEDANQAKQQIAALNKQIVKEQRVINLLEADWSYLNQPARLQALVKRHNKALNLGVMGLEQIVTFDRLPDRLQDRVSKTGQFDREGLDGLAAGIVSNPR